jgi:hypothetical protein
VIAVEFRFPANPILLHLPGVILRKDKPQIRPAAGEARGHGHVPVVQAQRAQAGTVEFAARNGGHVAQVKHAPLPAGAAALPARAR